MFDLFGMSKADAKDAIREMMNGATTGILDSFWYRLDEQDRTIKELREKLLEEGEYKKKYEELSQVLSNLKKHNEEKVNNNDVAKG